MEVNGQLHAPAALPPKGRKENKASTEEDGAPNGRKQEKN